MGGLGGGWGGTLCYLRKASSALNKVLLSKLLKEYVKIQKQ